MFYVKSVPEIVFALAPGTEAGVTLNKLHVCGEGLAG